MSLENLNLVELNAQEIQETEGGFLPLLIIGAALLLGSCTNQNNVGGTNNTYVQGNVNINNGTQVQTTVDVPIVKK